MTLLSVLLVGMGGFFGAIARYGVSQWFNQKMFRGMPLSTLTVNLTGSLLLGIIIGSAWNNLVTLALGTGFLGAFTTFSTFNLESVKLHKKQLVLYQAISYGGGIGLAFLGIWLGYQMV